MKELNFNKILKYGRKSKLKVTKKIINWFIKRYFSCDIQCQTDIADSVIFAHNALSCVVHQTTIIEDNVFIQHGVTLGMNKSGKGPSIRKNVFIGPRAIVLGDIDIGEGTVIAAGAVVLHDCEAFCLYAGNPAKKIREITASWNKINSNKS